MSMAALIPGLKVTVEGTYSLTARRRRRETPLWRPSSVSASRTASSEILPSPMSGEASMEFTSRAATHARISLSLPPEQLRGCFR